MACWTRQEAAKHRLHQVQISSYANDESVTVECMTCNEVLVAFEDLEPPSTPDERWKDDSIQFPRLLAEIVATQKLDMGPLSESMDLPVYHINELFDRAQTVWEKLKEEV